MSEQQPLLSSDVEAGNEEEKVLTWRERTGEFLESAPLHKFVITLIAIDAICVLADLSYSFLSEGCTPEGPEGPLWLEILSHISLTITTFFLVEIPLSIWAFGLAYYKPGGEVLHSSLHLFDACVIVTTFVLEVVLRGKERELASLLIILRLWRLVKLVGGIAVGAGEVEEEIAKDLAETNRRLNETLNVLAHTKEENEKLRARIVNLGGSLDGL
ncbi:hypothetical protein JAAARDRAFT_31699 [Jaapia argillacea MUCL 33604]|uniref:Voltage-gated hydrogen channel 1 n=1 Tax=Jaapia argillacea MUCL 33604 TaxID=933084 RepID=A0A067Q0X2_9AGAM|nr:hypothetical protein JAAARDRAFT_31699 [Jaapia argillacea MUCL 33604]